MSNIYEEAIKDVIDELKNICEDDLIYGQDEVESELEDFIKYIEATDVYIFEPIRAEIIRKQRKIITLLQKIGFGENPLCEPIQRLEHFLWQKNIDDKLKDKKTCAE